jgi:two-component system sensor histidine kinase YesM
VKLIQLFKNLKFKWKLYLSYIVVIVIPIMVLGIYSYEQSKVLLLKEARQGLNDSLKQITENINYKINRYQLVMRVVTENPQIVQMLNTEDVNYFRSYVNFTEQLDPFFQTIYNLSSDLLSMVIYTGNKTLTERYNSLQYMDRIADQPWFSEVVQTGKVYWHAQDPYLIGVGKFYDLNVKSPSNLLYMKLKYDAIFSNMEMDKIRNYGFLIIDQNHQLLFSKDHFSNHKPDPTIKETIPRLSEGTANIDGTKYIIMKSVIKEMNWSVYFYLPTAEIAINASSIVKATVYIVFFCLLFLLLLVWIFSRTFVKRIYSLNNKMKIVEYGNFDIEVSSQSKDEIGELTNRFGRMLRRVNSLIDEVYQSKIDQKEAELKMLQARINPHFLYNSLSIINWKAITMDAMEISRITVTLSKYYRTILSHGRSFVTIQNELENTKSYIEIQLIMHDHNFDVLYNIDPEIVPFYMIPILLQPIVENAIEHGIDHKREGRGTLSISGMRVQDYIEIVIADNGPGIPPSIMKEIFSNDGHGYGLRNVHERIKVVCGDAYGLVIESEEQLGTKVKLMLPCYTTAESH